VAASGDDGLESQVSGAEAFLQQNQAEISRLMSFPGVDAAYLDFGVYREESSAAQFFRFPPDLLRLVGALNVHLELSVYDAREAAENASE